MLKQTETLHCAMPARWMIETEEMHHETYACSAHLEQMIPEGEGAIRVTPCSGVALKVTCCYIETRSIITVSIPCNEETIKMLQEALRGRA